MEKKGEDAKWGGQSSIAAKKQRKLRCSFCRILEGLHQDEKRGGKQGIRQEEMSGRPPCNSTQGGPPSAASEGFQGAFESHWWKGLKMGWLCRVEKKRLNRHVLKSGCCVAMMFSWRASRKKKRIWRLVAAAS